MEYGVLLNRSTDNVGDDIQSYAAMRFLPSVDCIVDREQLDTFGADRPNGSVSVIMNSWYMYQKFNWPPSPAINPLWLSVHIAVNDYFGIGDRFLDSVGGEYLKHYAPIGVRDEATADLLHSKGIETYFSGCLTLTLDLPPVLQKSDEVILVDVEEKSSRILKSRYPNENWVEITHDVEPRTYQCESVEKRFEAVETLLKRYQRAKCVITSRLHCALPCLALGTPVFLVYRQSTLDRMQSFLPLLHGATPEELAERADCFDVANPPENEPGYLPIREELVERCRAFIAAAERGEAPKPFVRPVKDIHSWQKTLLYGMEPSFRETILRLGQWSKSLERDRDWNAEQLQSKDARIAELEGWIKELEKAKTYGEEQEKNKEARIAELEGWIKELEKAKTYVEEQEKNKEARIAELESWTKELEKAKTYGEEQGKVKDRRIAELESWTRELEKAKSWLLSEIESREAKLNSLSERLVRTNALLTAAEREKGALRQALKTELEKPWYKKLVHQKSNFDFTAEEESGATPDQEEEEKPE